MKNKIREKAKELFNIVIEQPLRETWFGIKSNLYKIANVATLASMILIYFYGQEFNTARPGIIASFVYYFITASMRRIALSKGNIDSKIPMPSKRFTNKDEFGEVSIRQDELQEVILYLSELEDYLQVTGRLKK